MLIMDAVHIGVVKFNRIIDPDIGTSSYGIKQDPRSHVELCRGIQKEHGPFPWIDKHVGLTELWRTRHRSPPDQDRLERTQSVNCYRE